MKHLLIGAREEIRRLRQDNEILGAKVETMELLGAMFMSRPLERGGAYAPDIAWELDEQIREIEAAELEKAAKTPAKS